MPETQLAGIVATAGKSVMGSVLLPDVDGVSVADGDFGHSEMNGATQRDPAASSTEGRASSTERDREVAHRHDGGSIDVGAVEKAQLSVGVFASGPEIPVVLDVGCVMAGRGGHAVHRLDGHHGKGKGLEAGPGTGRGFAFGLSFSLYRNDHPNSIFSLLLECGPFVLVGNGSGFHGIHAGLAWFWNMFARVN